MTQEKKILIVDDEPDIIEILRYNLEKEGYITFSANNGVDAVELARQKKPDLILLDVMLPDMDGIEACETIRKNEDLNNTIIAFLTARSEDYSEIAGFQAGADDYITKPIRPKVLLTRIQSLLKRSSSQGQQQATTRAITVTSAPRALNTTGVSATFWKAETIPLI